MARTASQSPGGPERQMWLCAPPPRLWGERGPLRGLSLPADGIPGLISTARGTNTANIKSRPLFSEFYFQVNHLFVFRREATPCVFSLSKSVFARRPVYLNSSRAAFQARTSSSVPLSVSLSLHPLPFPCLSSLWSHSADLLKQISYQACSTPDPFGPWGKTHPGVSR